MLHGLKKRVVAEKQAISHKFALQLFPDFCFYSMLHIAAAGSLKNVTENLLEAGHLYSVDVENRTPLFYAITQENGEVETLF